MTKSIKNSTAHCILLIPSAVREKCRKTSQTLQLDKLQQLEIFVEARFFWKSEETEWRKT